MTYVFVTSMCRVFVTAMCRVFFTSMCPVLWSQQEQMPPRPEADVFVGWNMGLGSSQVQPGIEKQTSRQFKADKQGLQQTNRVYGRQAETMADRVYGRQTNIGSAADKPTVYGKQTESVADRPTESSAGKTSLRQTNKSTADKPTQSTADIQCNAG